MSRFTQALIRPPASNFADGLTTVDLGVPDFALTLRQHAAYCNALAGLGVAMHPLPASTDFPDSTFVEDTAILTARGALLCRPGAVSRAGEVALVRAPLATAFDNLAEIVAPGTLDGGDVCEAGDHFFIGLSQRTNEAGAEQLTAWLAARGYSASTIDIRGMLSCIKSEIGIVYAGIRGKLADSVFIPIARFIEHGKILDALVLLRNIHSDFKILSVLFLRYKIHYIA